MTSAPTLLHEQMDVVVYVWYLPCFSERSVHSEWTPLAQGEGTLVVLVISVCLAVAVDLLPPYWLRYNLMYKTITIILSPESLCLLSLLAGDVSSPVELIMVKQLVILYQQQA